MASELSADSLAYSKCDRILENLPFGHIGRSDIIVHIS